MQPDDVPSTAASTPRLADLHSSEILDTPPDAAFDEIAVVAAALCQTPIALISLVDKTRQWFKAKVGLAIEGTPIEQSVCAHGLTSSEPLIIPDLTCDPRTRSNILVTGEAGLRFYAGAPIVSSAGNVIGMVCTIDTEPRPEGLSDSQIDGLRALARQTMALIDLRRSIGERDAFIASLRDAGSTMPGRPEAGGAMQLTVQDRDEHVQIAQLAGGIGTFEVDLATDMLTVSAQFCAIFGLIDQPTCPASVLEALVYEADRSIPSSPGTRRAGDSPLDVEYRIRRADTGAIRWVARRASFVEGEDGVPAKMVGTVQDVSERRSANDRVNALLNLGDRLRTVSDLRTMAAIAVEAIGTTLLVDRAGYASVEASGATFTVRSDWTIDDSPSLVGEHPAAAFATTIARLAGDQTIAVANMPSATWLAADWPGFASIGVKAQVHVPLVVRGALRGAIFVHSRTPRTWTKAEIEFLHGVVDRLYSSITRIRAVEHQHLLNSELSHRLKNMLSMVQAIASQTLRPIGHEPAVDVLHQRLHAFGTAHDILLQKNWVSADLGDLAERMVETIGGESGFTIEGPSVRLSPRTTVSVTMLLHELATNAMKYGALSVIEGMVHLGWRIEADPDGAATLVVAWRETGGPPAAEPARQGFGSRLIAMGLTGAGGASLGFGPDGFAAEFRAPLEDVQRA